MLRATERLAQHADAARLTRRDAGRGGTGAARGPFVTLTYAQSLDGSIASEPGRALRLSNDATMTMTHMLRSVHDFILVGVGTVIADDPRLNVRRTQGPSPRPAVLDSRLRTPLHCKLLTSEECERPVILTTAAAAEVHGSVGPDGRPLASAAAEALRAAGARVLVCDTDALGRVCPRSALAALRGLGEGSSVMVEGGASVIDSFLRPALPLPADAGHGAEGAAATATGIEYGAPLADQLIVTVAPLVVGGVRTFASGGVAATLASLAADVPVFPRLHNVLFTPFGDDVVITGDVMGPKAHAKAHAKAERAAARASAAPLAQAAHAAAVAAAPAPSAAATATATATVSALAAAPAAAPAAATAATAAAAAAEAAGASSGESESEHARPSRPRTRTQFVAESPLPTNAGTFRCRVYKCHGDDAAAAGLEPVVMVFGDVDQRHEDAGGGGGGDHLEAIPMRVHDQCFTSEVMGSLKCDCADQLEWAKEYVVAHGKGVIVYLQQEGRGIGLANKIRAYALQENEGLDTVDANRRLGLPDDTRIYWPVADVLRDLGIRRVQLLTNNPRKAAQLEALGVQIESRTPVVCKPGEHSVGYLRAKEQRMGHVYEDSQFEEVHGHGHGHGHVNGHAHAHPHAHSHADAENARHRHSVVVGGAGSGGRAHDRHSHGPGHVRPRHSPPPAPRRGSVSTHAYALKHTQSRDGDSER